MSATPSLADALDKAPCGFLAFDDEGVIAAVNETAADLLGYERSELVGRHLQEILTVGSRIFYQTHLFPLVKLHGAAQEMFLLLRTRDAGDLGVFANVKRQERGGSVVNDCVFMQVSERRKYEDALLRAKQDADEARTDAERRQQELQRANELLELQRRQLEDQATELESAADELRVANETLTETNEIVERERTRADEANHAKSAFLANMSHELRTPLNAIGGYSQLLELGVHGELTADQIGVLRRVQRSQQHLLRLINDVLNLSRIEAGHVEFHLEPLVLRGVVHGVMPMIDPQFGAKGVARTIDVAEGLVVRADRDKLEQILLNLLSNAVKFTPADGRVTIAAAPCGERAGFVCLSVADTGIGIPAIKLESVFQPFVQIQGEIRTGEGTGLGLTISRDLARGMGGDIHVTSVDGQGSVFTITLPLDVSPVLVKYTKAS